MSNQTQVAGSWIRSLAQKKFIIRILVILCCGSLLSACLIRGNHWGQRFFKGHSDDDSLSVTSSDISGFLSSVRPAGDNIETQYRLARHFQDQGRHEIAEEILQDIVRKAPDHDKSYNALGILYDSRRTFDLSETAYKKALQLNPNSHSTYNNLGYSFYLQDNFAAAVTFFKKAVALNPSKKLYHNNLGLCYSHLGDVKNARDEFLLSGNQPYVTKMERLLVTNPPTEIPEAAPEQTENEIHSQKFMTHPVLAVCEKESSLQGAFDKDASADDADSCYAVQAGAFYKRNHAWDLFGKLCASGFKDIYVKKDHSFYRVRLGWFGTENEAQEIITRISAMCHLATFVVTEKRPVENIVICSSSTRIPSGSNGLDRCGFASIEISNGNGVGKMAKGLGSYLSRHGFKIARLTNAHNFRYENTRIFYKKDHFNTAYNLAQRLAEFDLEVHVVQSDQLRQKVKVLIGKDLIPFKKTLNEDRLENLSAHQKHISVSDHIASAQ